MVGANYMGGKRNAVKSKLRDTTSRAQQGFFGRRRFELLSKGLAPTNQSDINTDANGSKKRLEISLAHARNKHPQHLINPYAQTPSPILAQPTRVPENPCSNQRPEADGLVHMASEISPRSLRERALSLPDLAGLKRGDTAPRRSCDTKAAKSPQGTNSAKSTHSSYARQSTPSLSLSMSPDTGSVQSRSRWRSPSSRVDQPIFRESPSDNISLPFFSSSLSPLLSDFSSLDRIEKQIRDGESSPLRYVSSNISRHGTNKTMSSSFSPIAFPEDGEEISAQTSDFDLEDLSEPLGQFEPDTKVNRGEESLHTYSDLWSPFRFTSPSAISGASLPNTELRGGDHKSLLLESDTACSRSPTNNTSPFTWLQTSRDYATPSPHYDCDWSPRLGNGYGSPAWLTGCIFDYEDPWDAIGIIMGLSPNNPNKLTLEEELATFGADEFGCATAASDDAGCNDALEDYSDDRTSYTMFSPAPSWVGTTQKRSGSSCISQCNNVWKAHPRDAVGSSEPTDLADVSTGCLTDGDFMAHKLPDCFDEVDLDSALTCYETRSPSYTKSPAIAPSPHWPLSPTHTISTNDNHFPLLSYDRQLERSPNTDFVAEEKPEPDSVTIVPSPDRASPVDTASFTRHQLPLVGDDGGQVESHSDNNAGIDPSLTLAFPSSALPAEDLNSYTINGEFRGLCLFRDDSDTETHPFVTPNRKPLANRVVKNPSGPDAKSQSRKTHCSKQAASNAGQTGLNVTNALPGRTLNS